MSNEIAKQKWNHIYGAECTTAIQPADVLAEYEYLLPNTGVALDLASGLGGNAVFLSQHGLDVHAWDISEQAINKLIKFCEKNDIHIKATVRDVLEHPPIANSFDVICVSYFLERNITNSIISALKPKGLLFYQTFIHENVTEYGPSNPKYRLAENELLSLFSPLHILAYQELGRVGKTTQGVRDTASLVAQKR